MRPFAQALPLVFDSDGAFEGGGTDKGGNEFYCDVRDGTPGSLHLLVGLGEGDEGGCVRCALGPSFLFEDPSIGEDECASFATAVKAHLYQFGAGVMQFLLTLAHGTYALPLSAVRKARRCARDDDEVPLDPNGSDSGAASRPTARERLKTPFSERITFVK